jgi:uncharacterized surface protein with fasciclin (FAS1) repeats
MALLKSLVVAGISAMGVAIALPAMANSCSLSAMDEPMAGMTGEMAEPMMDPMADGPTIVDIASSSEAFQTLTAALTAADLVEVLQGEGPFTVFAPTDEAFAALPPGTLEMLLEPENRDLLVSILTYHVVPGSVMSTDLESGMVDSAEGRPIMVEVSDAGVMVNSASVLMADIEASNGVIHVIDQVILPPDM